MKKTIITVALTILLTSTAWYVASRFQQQFQKTWLRSAVKAPGRMALDVIRADLQEGNPAMATAHLGVLQEAWARFEAEDGYVDKGIGNIMVEFRDMPLPSPQTRTEQNGSAPTGTGQ